MLLQVLRVRHAPAPPPGARRGRGPDRRGGAQAGQGAPGAHRGGARRAPGRGGSAARLGVRDLPRLRGLVVRAGARARDAAPHEPGRALARRPRAAAGGDRVAGAHARIRAVRPRRPRGVAHQASGPAAGDHPRRGRAADPVHQRDPRRHRRGRGGPDRRSGGARGGPRGARSPPGGDPPELRAPPPLLRRGRRGCGECRVGELLANGAVRGTASRPPSVGLAGGDRGDEAPGGRVQAVDRGRGGASPTQPGRVVARARGGGRDGPRRIERQRRPHIPRASVPLAHRGEKAALGRRGRAVRAPVRLSPVHRLGLARAGCARRRQGPVLELHPPARLRPAPGPGHPERSGAGRDREGSRGHRAVSRRAHRAVRRDAA